MITIIARRLLVEQSHDGRLHHLAISSAPRCLERLPHEELGQVALAFPIAGELSGHLFPIIAHRGGDLSVRLKLM